MRSTNLLTYLYASYLPILYIIDSLSLWPSYFVLSIRNAKNQRHDLFRLLFTLHIRTVYRYRISVTTREPYIGPITRTAPLYWPISQCLAMPLTPVLLSSSRLLLQLLLLMPAPLAAYSRQRCVSTLPVSAPLHSFRRYSPAAQPRRPVN